MKRRSGETVAALVPRGKIHHAVKFGSRTNMGDQVNYVLQSYCVICPIANRRYGHQNLIVLYGIPDSFGTAHLGQYGLGRAAVAALGPATNDMGMTNLVASLAQILRFAIKQIVQYEQST